MRESIGFFSDVHSNLRALEAMCGVVAERQSDCKWYFGGDLVGWLYEPIECVQLLMDMVRWGLIYEAVLGDHDLLALDAFSDDPDPKKQVPRKIATAFQAGALSREPEARAFMESRSLLVDIPEAGCVIAHHSPFSLPRDKGALRKEHFPHLPEVFEDQLMAWSLYGRRVILSGQDHIPAVHRIQAGLQQPTLDDVATVFPPDNEGLAVDIEPGYNYWVQSGAAGGPPRDGVLDLNWAELAPGEMITLHRQPFDFYGTREVIERRSFGSMLDWERFAGRTKQPIAQGRATW